MNPLVVPVSRAAMVGRGLGWGALYGLLVGALAGTALWPIIGTFFGAVSGALVGGAFGLVGGGVLALLDALSVVDADLDGLARARVAVVLSSAVCALATVWGVGAVGGRTWGWAFVAVSAGIGAANARRVLLGPPRRRPLFASISYSDPRYMDPRHVDPRHVDPRHVDPRHVDPRHVDPRRRRTPTDAQAAVDVLDGVAAGALAGFGTGAAAGVAIGTVSDPVRLIVPAMVEAALLGVPVGVVAGVVVVGAVNLVRAGRHR